MYMISEHFYWTGTLKINWVIKIFIELVFKIMVYIVQNWVHQWFDVSLKAILKTILNNKSQKNRMKIIYKVP